MTSSRLVRGAKTRMIACVCFVLLLGALVYVFHGTQARLADVQKIANSCKQQTESLSAQFQVLFEYKLRLEKSLQTEKRDHKKAVEEAEKKMKDEKEERLRDREEANAKYDIKSKELSDLKSKYDEMKEQNEKAVADLTAQMSLIKNSRNQLKINIDEFDKERIAYKSKVSSLESEIGTLKDTITDLKARELPPGDADKLRDELRSNLNKAQKKLGECEASKGLTSVREPGLNLGSAADILMPKNDSPIAQGEEMKHALEPPAEISFQGESKGSSSTTPGINPQAVDNADSSSPKPLTKESQKRNGEEMAFLNFKKSTPEVRVGAGQAVPLPMPGAQESAHNQDSGNNQENGIGQIPIPNPDFAKLNPQQGNSAVERQVPQPWGDDDKKGDMNDAAMEDMNDLSAHFQFH